MVVQKRGKHWDKWCFCDISRPEARLDFVRKLAPAIWVAISLPLFLKLQFLWQSLKHISEVWILPTHLIFVYTTCNFHTFTCHLIWTNIAWFFSTGENSLKCFLNRSFRLLRTFSLCFAQSSRTYRYRMPTVSRRMRLVFRVWEFKTVKMMLVCVELNKTQKLCCRTCSMFHEMVILSCLLP